MGGCCAPGGGVLVAACASQKQQHVTSTQAGEGGAGEGSGSQGGKMGPASFSLLGLVSCAHSGSLLL